jgi:hypothetical protein
MRLPMQRYSRRQLKQHTLRSQSVPAAPIARHSSMPNPALLPLSGLPERYCYRTPFVHAQTPRCHRFRAAFLLRAKAVPPRAAYAAALYRACMHFRHQCHSTFLELCAAATFCCNVCLPCSVAQGGVRGGAGGVGGTDGRTQRGLPPPKVSEHSSYQ